MVFVFFVIIEVGYIYFIKCYYFYGDKFSGDCFYIYYVNGNYFYGYNVNGYYFYGSYFYCYIICWSNVKGKQVGLVLFMGRIWVVVV